MIGGAKRIVFEVIGWVLLVAGVAALILPGPGLLMVFAGLAVLSQQYDWAERRVDPIKHRALETASDGVQSWPRIVLSGIGVLWLVAVGIYWGIRPDAPSWWPIADKWWLVGGWGTGGTLIGSAAIALGLSPTAVPRT